MVLPIQARLESFYSNPNQIKNKQKYERIKNIRKDCCPQTSRKIINDKGGWDKNCACAKAV